MNPQDTHRSAPLMLLGFIAILFIASSFIPARWFGIQPVRQPYQKIDLSQVELKDIATDTNKDGVISWKEIILSNANASDTTAAAQDKVDPAVVAELNDPNNLTASFSKNLYLASAYLKKNDIVDTSAQQGVLGQLVQQEAQKLSVRTYTINDLAVTKTETVSSLRAYGNTIAPILEGIITKQSIIDDVGAITAYSESNDSTVLLPLEKDYIRVKAQLDKLVAIPVPLSAATYHLIIVNRVSAYADMLYNLSRAADDPLRSAISVEQYGNVMTSTLRSFPTLSNYFKTEQVTFTPKDPGYVFIAGFTLN